MKLHPETCDARRLDLFLRNRLPEHFQHELEMHLQTCPTCRNRLDELAGGARWWKEVRHYLGGDGAAEMLRTADPASPRRPVCIDLDFLEPSDNAGSLGRLGAYEVVELLGRGGTGLVLKAFDVALNRPVAIKVLAAEVAANGAARKRFAREAQAAAAVIHDHVVPVHAVDADASPPYLVMAFIPGQSLQQRIDRTGPLQLKEILRIGMQTASGLAAAHAQGLVHRDIKPANIMLENGIERVRITDFGLARAVDDASLTQSGTVAGTPQYMAPEQAQGEAVDQRADLFALGSTLYAMCTGHAPFRGHSGLAVLRQVCDVEPPPIRTLNPDVPSWLEGIIRKLHAKDPARRFQSAAEVAELLERCLAHVQQPDHQPLPRLATELGRRVPRPRPSRPVSRRWAHSAAVAAVVLCAVGLSYLARFTPQSNEVSTVVLRELEELQQAENELAATPADLQTRLDRLRGSLAPAAAEVGETPLDTAHRRADSLRRSLTAGAGPEADPVEAQLAKLRQQLHSLRERIDPRQ
jgi:eukaryotic-like serine/threonine-protein kinase